MYSVSSDAVDESSARGTECVTIVLLFSLEFMTLDLSEKKMLGKQLFAFLPNF